MNEMELSAWERKLEARQKDLDTADAELRNYAKEIQERERALPTTRDDVARTDYLFDQINRDNRKLVMEMPPVIQIAPPQQTTGADVMAAVMAAVAAVASVAALIAVIV